MLVGNYIQSLAGRVFLPSTGHHGLLKFLTAALIFIANQVLHRSLFASAPDRRPNANRRVHANLDHGTANATCCTCRENADGHSPDQQAGREPNG